MPAQLLGTPIDAICQSVQPDLLPMDGGTTVSWQDRGKNWPAARRKNIETRDWPIDLRGEFDYGRSELTFSRSGFGTLVDG